MTSRKSGMAASPFGNKRVPPRGTDAPRRFGLAEARRDAEEEEGGILRLSLDSIADNPDNPIARVDVDQEFVDSIAAVGVMTPVVVMRSAVFIEARPEHADALGAAEWVMLAGHRRKAGARAAGLTEVDAIDRDDLAPHLDEIVLHENTQRLDLTPMQEARALQRLLDRTGMSQRELAKTVAKSQGHISKRLNLLRLPVIVQEAVDAGEVTIVDASRIVEALGDDAAMKDAYEAGLVEERASGDRVQWVWRATNLRAKEEAQRRLVAVQAIAESEGAEFVEHPYERWGESCYNQKITDPEVIESAKAVGNLAISVGRNDSEVDYYLRKRVKPQKASAGPDHTEKQKERDRTAKLAREAAESRRRFIESRLADDLAFKREAFSWVTELMVTGDCLFFSAIDNLTQTFGRAAGLGGEEQTAGWIADARIRVTEKNARRLFAVCRALALIEGDPQIRRLHEMDYYDWLQNHGYVLTPWEQKWIADQVRVEDQE